MTTSIELWNEFKKLFANECESRFPDDLKQVWTTASKRTEFYVNTVFPKIAINLGLEVRKELFKVDVALCQVSNTGHNVPLVFIESENNAPTATHEIWKLASLNAPCRILIVCCEWSPDLWRYSKQDILMGEWEKIIKSHAEVWKLNGIIGIINAEFALSNSVFRLTSAAWDEEGSLFERPTKLLEMKD